MILVTGATDMTGQFVVRELLNRGHRVRVLARETSVDQVPAGAATAISDPGDFASLPAPPRASVNLRLEVALTHFW